MPRPQPQVAQTSGEDKPTSGHSQCGVVPFMGRWDCNCGGGEEDTPGSRGLEVGLGRAHSEVMRRLSGWRGHGSRKGKSGPRVPEAGQLVVTSSSLSPRHPHPVAGAAPKERKWEEEGHWRPGSPPPARLLGSPLSHAPVFCRARELSSPAVHALDCLSSLPLKTTSGLSCEERPLLRAPSRCFCITSP